MKNAFRSLTVSIALLAVVLLGISNTPAIARPIRMWTLQELFDEADVVVIVTASKPKETDNTDDFLPDYLQQLESELEVESVLKGKELATDTDEKRIVKFVHFRYREDVKSTLGNGPLLAIMGTTAVSVAHGEPTKPKYLLYLRKRKDGRYEPVSGRNDPVFSIVRLLVFPELDPALKPRSEGE